MLLNHIILAIAWIIYVVLHSVLATAHFKLKVQRAMGKHYKHYRLIYNIFAFVFLAVLVWFQLSIATLRLYEPSLLLIIFGSTVSALGLLIMLICIRKYFMRLSGLRSLLHERPATNLIISGVHRHVRHPLYSGTFIFIWGLLIVFPYLSLVVSNSIITIYTLLAIKFEEKKLVAEFGSGYSTYQKQVPKLIPKF